MITLWFFHHYFSLSKTALFFLFLIYVQFLHTADFYLYFTNINWHIIYIFFFFYKRTRKYKYIIMENITGSHNNNNNNALHKFIFHLLAVFFYFSSFFFYILNNFPVIHLSRLKFSLPFFMVLVLLYYSPVCVCIIYNIFIYMCWCLLLCIALNRII